MTKETSTGDFDPERVLTFWFSPESEPWWFEKSADFDLAVRTNLAAPYEAARDGGLNAWERSARSVLALVILLDQVPRNLFRGSAEAFATDGAALSVAKLAVDAGHDRGLMQKERLFLYLPFEHSESLADQTRSLELFRALDEDPKLFDYAQRHYDIIARFGRFPHRNSVLGRSSTAEELAFLATPGSSF